MALGHDPRAKAVGPWSKGHGLRSPQNTQVLTNAQKSQPTMGVLFFVPHFLGKSGYQKWSVTLVQHIFPEGRCRQISTGQWTPRKSWARVSFCFVGASSESSFFHPRRWTVKECRVRRSIDQPMGGRTEGRAEIDGRAIGRRDGLTDGRADRRLGGRSGRQTVGRTSDGRTNSRSDGRAVGRVGGRTDCLRSSQDCPESSQAVLGAPRIVLGAPNIRSPTPSGETCAGEIWPSRGNIERP